MTRALRETITRADMERDQAKRQHLPLANFVAPAPVVKRIGPEDIVTVDPYAEHMMQPVQHVTRYDANPITRSKAMVMKVHQVTIFLAVLTLAGMVVFGQFAFFLWLLLASLEWVGVFVVLAVLDYREQPSSLSRRMADRYMDLMEREQEARLRWQYGGDDNDNE